MVMETEEGGYNPDKEKAKIESEELTKGLNALLNFAESEDHLKEIGLGKYSSELYSIAEQIKKERDAMENGETSSETEKSWAEQEMERYKNQGEENTEAEKKKKWLEKFESEEGQNQRIEGRIEHETKEDIEEWIKNEEANLEKMVQEREKYIEKLRERNNNR